MPSFASSATASSTSESARICDAPSCDAWVARSHCSTLLSPSVAHRKTSPPSLEPQAAISWLEPVSKLRVATSESALQVPPPGVQPRPDRVLIAAMASCDTPQHPHPITTVMLHRICTISREDAGVIGAVRSIIVARDVTRNRDPSRMVAVWTWLRVIPAMRTNRGWDEAVRILIGAPV